MAQSSSFTVSYSGSIKSYTLAAGTWLITLKGAGGGGNYNYGTTASGETVSSYGSKGGYVQQRVKFTSDTTVYVVVGGAGNTGGSGGYNGGGASSGGGGGSGGGATHVAIKSGLITALNNSDFYCVAAGGGGGGGSPWLWDGENPDSRLKCRNGQTYNSSYVNGTNKAGAKASSTYEEYIFNTTFYGGGGGAGVPGGGSSSAWSGTDWKKKCGYGGKNYINTNRGTSVTNNYTGGASYQTNGSATFTFEKSAISSPTTVKINTSCYKYLYLRWSGQTGSPSSYNIQIAVNGNTSSPISKSTTSSHLNYDISSYAAGTTFSFRVQSNGVSSYSEWSSTSTRKSIDSSGALKASDINNAQDVAVAMVTPLGGTFTKSAVTAGNKIKSAKVTDIATYVNGRWGTTLSISDKPKATEWQSLLDRL